MQLITKMSQAQITRLFNATYDSKHDESVRESLPEFQQAYESLMNRIISDYGRNGQITESIFDKLPLEEALIFTYLSTGDRYKQWWATLFGSISERDIPPSDTLSGIHFRGVAQSRVNRVSGAMKKTAQRRAASIIANYRKENPDKNIEQIADMILDSDDLKNSVDAMTLRTVRTEVNAAANESISYTATAMNGSRNLMKRWETAGDERVRPDHVRVGARKPIPFDALFNVGGTQMRFPSDPEAFGGNVAGQSINCRCRMVVVPLSRTRRFFRGITSFFGF